MEQGPEASILTRLERAEVAARERRLTAEAEAQRVLESSAEAVREIEARVPAEIAAALAELRERHLRRARDEVAAIEQELAELDRDRNAADAKTAGHRRHRAVRPPVHRGAEGPRFDAAVERVVTAVLGEEER